MSNAPSSPHELISAEENKLTTLTSRLFAMEAFLGELERVTRKKEFRIWNSVVWMMVLDSRDAFVIHFASWARGMYKKGGFLRQIQAHCLRNLRRKWKARGESDGRSRWFRELLASGHAESFARLFPEVKTPFPQPEDIDALRLEFISTFDVLVADRDGNRAHPYERGNPARMLNLVDLRALVTQSEGFLADVRLIACGSSYQFSDMNSTPVKLAAKELVDAILIGPMTLRQGRPLPPQREEYYADLHRRHDQAGGTGYFNERLTRTNSAHMPPDYARRAG